MQTCQICGKPANLNFQRVWVRYYYEPGTDEYPEGPTLCPDIEEPIEENNVHVCFDHEHAWR